MSLSDSLHIRREQIRVGQVIDQDEHWVTLRVAKDDLVEFNVSDGDQFFTLLFVQGNDGGGMKADFPWGERS